MKRYLQLLPVILFPYCVLSVLVSILNIKILEALFHDDALIPLLILFALYIAAPVWAVVVFAINLTQKKDAKELLRVSMVIKLIHIPTHILLFGIWLFCAIIFIGIPPILVFLAGMPIFLSGLSGLGGIIRGVQENRFSKKTAVLHGILQFVFCADVISSVVLYRRMNEISAFSQKNRCN